jgi:hypothetical protein
VEEFDDYDEVAAAEIMWGKEPLTVNQRWIKQTRVRMTLMSPKLTSSLNS